MIAYETETGELVGTQAEAKKLGKFKQEIIPDDKSGLIAYINKRVDRDEGPIAPDPTTPIVYGSVDITGVELPPAREPATALNILAKMDAPEGVDVDKIVETIMTAKGYPLVRYATATAMAFQRLGEKK